MKSVLKVAGIGALLIAFQAILAPLTLIPSLAIPMPYVLFWLTLPFSWEGRLSLMAAFIYGIILDIFFPPHGLQTLCGLWVWAVRRLWLRILNPQLSPDSEKAFSLSSLERGEFFAYVFPLTAWHHLWYLFLARWTIDGNGLIYFTLSTIYTFVWEWIIFELVLRTTNARA
ncbi:MAG: hypothetical protein RMJ66_05005 [Bacteroidia bacterium]|nr:hypothetical protein [Bacteroidia bacterium]MDW8134405.1 hypothetical protein [Bacteroidia bacterium]